MSLIIDNRAIFFHVYKTGGTTIRKYFKDSKLSTRECGKFHFGTQEVSKKLKLEKYFKFSFVRNPYTWLTSIHGQIAGHNNHFLHKRYEKKSFDFFIKDFLENVLNKMKDNGVRATTQDEILEGHIDFIGKLENLQKDFDHVLNVLGLESKELPHCNKRRYRVNKNEFYLYTPESKEFVKHFLKKDFIRFGYEF